VGGDSVNASNLHHGLSLALRDRLSRYIFVAADTFIAGVSVIWTVWVTIF
jgi:hypothetical protein